MKTLQQILRFLKKICLILVSVIHIHICDTDNFELREKESDDTKFVKKGETDDRSRS